MGPIIELTSLVCLNFCPNARSISFLAHVSHFLSKELSIVFLINKFIYLYDNFCLLEVSRFLKKNLKPLFFMLTKKISRFVVEMTQVFTKLQLSCTGVENMFT